MISRKGLHEAVKAPVDIAIFEAMKMEHTLVAPIEGTVAEIAVAQDAQVAEGAKVMVIERTSAARQE
jgi:3-methylcrotonyl-CoA carboxylase alpha subunit